MIKGSRCAATARRWTAQARCPYHTWQTDRLSFFSDRLLYPEGIMALSPGLRRKELPWVVQLTDLFNRNAVVAGWIALGARAATPLALESFFGS